MNNKKYWIIAVLVIGALALGACGGATTAAEEPVADAAAEEAAPADEMAAEVTYDENGIPVYGCLGSADTALVDLDCREVTIAVENAYLPFNYIFEGKAGGWDYVVIPQICELLHCTPVFQECSWDIMIQSVADGLYDMAGDGITITDERDEIVDFSDSYISIDQRLLVNMGEDRFASIEDFVADPALILGTQVATTNYETAASYLAEDRISAFEQFPFAVQSLMSNDVDAVLIDEQAGLGYIAQDPEALEFVGPAISSDELGFVFPNDSDLVEPFNTALAELISNGFLEDVNTQFFGLSFTLTYDDIE
ncbi:MAG: polar amino acid transport system substrate-binding protein [Chloroflexota bacterium]|nr:polar amino acid transport system substrate-binding protein [Chloroflexota bacterium]